MRKSLPFCLPACPPAVYNFLVQQWTGYKEAVAAAGGVASAGVGVTEAALMNRALSLLSKIFPWVGDKTMEDDSHDFLPVSTVSYRTVSYHTVSSCTAPKSYRVQTPTLP